MMFARRADLALPVGGANMSEPQDAASESMRQTAMPGHGWPAPEGDDVRAQRSRSGFAGRRSHLSGGPWMARSESSSQTAMPGHGWPAPEGDDVRAQRSRSGFAGRRSHLSGGPWMARSESSLSPPLSAI